MRVQETRQDEKRLRGEGAGDKIKWDKKRGDERS